MIVIIEFMFIILMYKVIEFIITTKVPLNTHPYLYVPSGMIITLSFPDSNVCWFALWAKAKSW